MSKTLIIVESPTKAKTIGKFLGKQYTVVSSMGHVKDLPKSKIGVDPENNFEISYVTPSKAKKNLTALRKTAKECDEVILATDEDREGEAISWHLAHALKLNPDSAKRIVFHEITKSAITEALSHPRTLNQHLVDAQQARRALDRLVGYTLSPFLWEKVQRGLSAGRVQSVALRLIVEREREIQAFEAQEYWSITGTFQTPESGQLVAQLTKAKGKSCDKFRFTNEQDAQAMVTELKQQSYHIDEVKKKQTKKNPYPPYITSTLQQDAAKRLYFSSKQTMMIAQQLYEGITLGKQGSTGLITYMRTDSTSLSQQSLQAAQEQITKRVGKEYALDKPRMFKTKSQNAQEAHEAIRPTDPSLFPEDIKTFLTEEQYKLYRMIWSRFMASQMQPAVFDNTSVIITNQDQQVEFQAKGKVQTFDGFMNVYSLAGDDVYLPQVQEGSDLRSEDIQGNQHFTQPPGRYNESTLVKILEKHSIGRPSTYASIISTIQDRKYVEKAEDKRFIPTDIGVIVNDMLVAHFPEIVDIEFTAEVENEFDKIALGEQNYSQMLGDFYYPFKENLDNKHKEVERYRDIIPDSECPKCGYQLEMKRSKYGKFIGCTNYPDCKYRDKLPEEKAFDEQHGGETCEECGQGVMQVKRGRYGPFLGCSRYPECKHLKKIEKKTGETCPQCDKGELVWKKGKRKQQFKACNRYPDCDYIDKSKS